MSHANNAQDYPINARFCQVCEALEIEPKAERANESASEYYQRLVAYASALLQNRYVLERGAIRFKKLRAQGPAQALINELDGGGKRGILTRDVAELAVRRLLGFVHCANSETLWSQVPRGAKHELEPGETEPTKAWLHNDVYGIVPARIRDKIYELCISAPNEVERYVKQAITYLEKDGADPLPEPPWNQPYEFENGHEFILEFLNAAKHARHDITVAAVNSYITASIGGQVFLHALKRGVSVRFLIFDFVHGDVPQVARMIRRSEEALQVFANDTMEALLWLRERANAERAEGKLEIRLLKQDPQGRWYLIDALGDATQGLAFVVPRAAGSVSKAANAAGGQVPVQEIVRRSLEVEALWSNAQPLDEWLKSYEVWRAGHETQRILGQRGKEL